MYGILWPDGVEGKLGGFQRVQEGKDAKKLVRKIVEENLVRWEETLRGVTPPKEEGGS